ncbi:MAG TPA: hypothetical protein VKU41_28060 [Polyangiaceae bacterium]|nr:hypothetical protein [Polyangiaceae bacterium]
MSSATNELVRLAKADAPSAAARAKMWASVSNAVGGLAGAGGAGAAVGTTGSMNASATIGAAKMLTIGTLLGGPLTVGLAAVMLQVGAPTNPTRSPQVAPASVARPAARAIPVQEVAPRSAPVEIAATAAMHAAAPAPAGHATGAPTLNPHPLAHPKAKAARGPDPDRDDALAREAGHVMEAHAALRRGDPAAALRAIASARALAPPQLVPEELAVEGQALRALGRTSEADGNEAQLRLFYPEAALAR